MDNVGPKIIRNADGHHPRIDKKVAKEHKHLNKAQGSDVPIKYSQTQVQPVSLTHLQRHRVLTGRDPEEYANGYALLRTQVLQRLAAKSWNALAITSGGPGQGKSLTAINLAISLARDIRHTVLLVDFDLRRPAVHRYLGLQPRYGVADYLLHDVPIHEILVNPGMERLVVLPGKDAVHNPSELLAAPKTARLVEELKSRYPGRIIVFDLPPVLTVDDALAFSPYVDAALLVVEENKATKEEIARAIQLLHGTHLLGTVLNKSREKLPIY